MNQFGKIGPKDRRAQVWAVQNIAAINPAEVDKNLSSQRAENAPWVAFIGNSALQLVWYASSVQQLFDTVDVGQFLIAPVAQKHVGVTGVQEVLGGLPNAHVLTGVNKFNGIVVILEKVAVVRFFLAGPEVEYVAHLNTGVSPYERSGHILRSAPHISRIKRPLDQTVSYMSSARNKRAACVRNCADLCPTPPPIRNNGAPECARARSRVEK